jgi:hypothetical protein
VLVSQTNQQRASTARPESPHQAGMPLPRESCDVV